VSDKVFEEASSLISAEAAYGLELSEPLFGSPCSGLNRAQRDFHPEGKTLENGSEVYYDAAPGRPRSETDPSSDPAHPHRCISRKDNSNPAGPGSCTTIQFNAVFLPQPSKSFFWNCFQFF